MRECDRDLGERLRAAERFTAEIERHISAGKTLVRRLSEVSGNKGPLAGARTSRAATATAAVTAASPAPNARSTLAAGAGLSRGRETRGGDAA